MECSICFDGLNTDYTDTTDTITLRCRHSFHHQCISRWYQENSACPYCRHKIWKDDLDFGLVRTFYESNGTPKEIYMLVNGKKEGYYHKFNENKYGTIILCEYHDGVLHGQYESFYENRMPRIVCHFRNGVLIGNIGLFDEKGNRQVLYDYDDYNGYTNAELMQMINAY